MIKIADLKLNPDNPREISDTNLERLKKSVTEFEKMLELRPIIIDEKNVVLAGNMRLRALADLGYTELKPEWVKQAKDLTAKEKREFVIKDNSNFGQYDWDALANGWDDLPLTEWGVDIPNYVANDIDEHWDGMPEFEQEDLTSLQRIVVHFDTREDVEEFARLIGQSLTEKTKAIWFPYKKPEPLKAIAMRYEP